MYQIEYARDAVKALLALPRNVSLHIRGKIEQLAADPFATNSNVRKFVGREAYRLRVGDWRVIYEIEGDRLVFMSLPLRHVEVHTNDRNPIHRTRRQT